MRGWITHSIFNNKKASRKCNKQLLNKYNLSIYLINI